MLRRQTLLRASALCFLFACTTQNVESVTSSESDILPNANIFDVDHDGATFRLIAEHFEGLGFDMNVDLEQFAPSWPLDDASPSVLNRLGTPILFAEFGYYHTGFDAIRSNPEGDENVLAPHDGLALMFDWAGNRSSDTESPYTAVVAIYDPVSHVVTQIMHLSPTAAIAQATDPVPVQRGEVIGTLAKPPIDGPMASALKHVQIAFVDGANKKLLNPAVHFADYADTVAPTASSVYVTDEEGSVRTSDFVTGKLDFVVDAFDRDDHSERNLEVSAIAFTITDQDGNVVASQPKCTLDHLYESLEETASFRAKHLVDFGSAVGQAFGGWPHSDVANPDRTFRYALTQLAVDEEGRCTVLDDEDGYLEVTDEMTQLDISVTLWDAKDNETETAFELVRAGN